MAKFDDYTQKNTPEDNDITLILDKTANVNKKTPFSGIWNWIVGKLTDAVIDNLQTLNKTMIGAINELNSKILIGANKRYIKVVSNNSNLNWGGILLATKANVLLVSINGEGVPIIEWMALTPTSVTVSTGEDNPLETIIDTGSSNSHILAIPIGDISKARITFTD